MGNPEREYVSRLSQHEATGTQYSSRMRRAVGITALVAGILFQRELIAGGVRGVKKVIHTMSDSLDQNK